LDCWDRADKEEVEINEDEESYDFPAVGKKEAEKKRAKGDENGKVKARNGEDVLEAEPTEFIAKGTVFYIASDERGKKCGGAVAMELLVEKFSELFFEFEAQFCKTPSVFDGNPFFGFEKVSVRGSHF
jgi:hypothetical protein